MGGTFVDRCLLAAPDLVPAPARNGPGSAACARARMRSPLLIALVTATGAILSTEAQARKTSGQHGIVHVTCSEVTFLMLGFPEGKTNTIHPKVKVNGKAINNFKAGITFYGSIAEFEIPVEIPVTGKYLIQAGATWNTNEVVGETTTTKSELTCTGDRPRRLHDRKGTAPRRRTLLHQQRTPGQNRADRRIPRHRQEHRLPSR